MPLDQKTPELAVGAVNRHGADVRLFHFPYLCIGMFLVCVELRRSDGPGIFHDSAVWLRAA